MTDSWDEVLDWERWAKEVLTDWRVPFDNHKVGLRLGITQQLCDLRDERDALAARLAALELAAWEAHEAIYCELEEPDQNSAAIISDAIAKLGELLPVQRPSVSASAVQPERCCLDYPRCDCNSPPEPDNEWHCSQYPGCECFAGCREKALEVPL